MYPINRAVVLVRAKQPFVDWLNGHPEAGESTLTLAQVNGECNAYLIEDYVDDVELGEILRDVYLDIFFHEMWSWYPTDEHTPKQPTLELFHEWFELCPSPLVLDLYADPIAKETGY